MARYRTKSTEVEAVKFTCNNIKEVMEFTGITRFTLYTVADGVITCIIKRDGEQLHVGENKYIIKGSDGCFYICSEDLFEEIYEEVKDNV